MGDTPKWNDVFPENINPADSKPKWEDVFPDKSKKKEDSESPSKVQTSSSFGKAKVYPTEQTVDNFALDQSHIPTKPETSFEYIMNKAGDGSLVKKMIDFGAAYQDNLTKNNPTPFASAINDIQTKATSHAEYMSGYDPSKLEDLAAFGMSMVLDAPIFGALGNGGQALSKPIIKALKLTEKNLIVDGLEKLTAKEITKNIAKKFAANTITGASSGAVALGGYNAMTDLKDQIESGKDLEDIDWGENLKAAGGGMIIGGSLGPIAPAFGLADKYLQNVISNSVLRKTAQYTAKAAEIPVEAGVFTLVGSSVDKKPVSWKSYFDNVLMVGTMKASNYLSSPRDLSADKTYDVKFKPEENTVFQQKGYDLSSSPTKIETILKDKDISLSAKAKVLWKYAGIRPEGLDFDIANTKVEQDGEGATLKVYNKSGDLVDAQKFASVAEADNMALTVHKNATELKAFETAKDMTIDQKAEVTYKIDEQAVRDAALIPMSQRTPEQQRLVTGFQKVVQEIKAKEPEEQLKRANEAVEASKQESGITIPTGEKTASASSSDAEQNVPEYTQRYKDALSKLPEADKKRLPTYKGKTFSIATIRPNGDIENVYLADSKAKHRQYMKPEDADAYEQGHVHLAWYDVRTGKFIDTGQNGYRLYDPAVMGKAEGAIEHPEATKANMKNNGVEGLDIQGIRNQLASIKSDQLRMDADDPRMKALNQKAEELRDELARRGVDSFGKPIDNTQSGIKETQTIETIPEQVLPPAESKDLNNGSNAETKGNEPIERQQTEVIKENLTTEPTKDIPIETKIEDNAISIEQPKEMVQRQPQETPEAGSERGRVEQSQQGNETTGSRQETAKEETLYKTEDEIKSALESGSLSPQEYNREVSKLRKSDFETSKEKLRQSLEGMFTKQAVGDEATKLTDVYDNLVAFIKDAIRLYGDKIGSARDVAKYGGVKYNKALQEAYDEAIGKKILDKEKKMRGFPKRIKEFQEFKDMKTDIESNPELRYDPQVLSDIKDKIATMSDEELVKASNQQGLDFLSEGNDNMAVLAYIERINRARAKGDDSMPIVEELSKKGTMWGQLIRQFAEVKGASAEGMLTVFEKTLEKQGRFMTDEQKAKFLELSNLDIDTRKKLKEASDLTRALPTDENLKKFDAVQKESDKAYTDLAKYMQEITPKNFWDMMGMAMQGNLLTPMSQITNIFANLTNVPITGASNTIASFMDRLHTMVTGSERVTTLDPRAMAEGVKGFVAGTKEALRQIKTGVNVNDKAEIQRGFRPWRSIQQAVSGENMAVTKAGKVAMGDRVNKLVEGLVGAPAETMFRLLNLGDKPFYRMAEHMTLYRIGKSQGLKGQDLQNFIRFPSQKAQAIAEKSAKEATFQEDSRTSKAATGIANTIRNAVPSGAWRFLMRTQMPYVKTPANIISQTMDIALPPLSMAKGVYEAYKGNKRESLVNLGKAGVGIMIGMGARYLLQHGLMTGSADKEKKVRGLQYDAFPPNSVNLSGLKRLMDGGDPSFQAGDEIMNYTKMGLVGMALGVQANIYETGRQLKAKDTENKLDDATTRTLSALIEIPSYALEQSFLQGTSTLITAISDKQWDYWLTNTFKAISSIPMPNTLDAANRATREYIPDLKGDNLSERLSNVIKNKTFATEDLPVTHNLWGDKILQNPEGANGWLFQMFNVAKLQELQNKPESKLIYDLYTKTENADVIPSVPSRQITVDSKVRKLTSEEYAKYIELVGKARKRRLDDKMKNDEFKSLTVEQKIKSLKRSWDLGQEEGKNQFLGRTSE